MLRAVGLLHPGAMGQRIGAALLQAGNEVWWCSDGRSGESLSRATRLGLREAKSLRAMVEKCNVIFCICPPSAAMSVCQTIFSLGFQGTYCDANALTPDDALKVTLLLHFTKHNAVQSQPCSSLSQIAEVCAKHASAYVDASIISFSGLRL